MHTENNLQPAFPSSEKLRSYRVGLVVGTTVSLSLWALIVVGVERLAHLI